MTEWTNAAMDSCVQGDVWSAFFWNFGGSWENNMNIILNQAHDYEKKYQYYAIQDYLTG